MAFKNHPGKNIYRIRKRLSESYNKHVMESNLKYVLSIYLSFLRVKVKVRVKVYNKCYHILKIFCKFW